MDNKILFLFLLNIIINVSYSSIKLIPIEEEYNFCYFLFNKNLSFNKIYLSYIPQEKKYILNNNNINNINSNSDKDNLKNKSLIDLLPFNNIYKYIVLKNKSLIIASEKIKNSNQYLSLYYFEYPLKQAPDYYYENKEISLNKNNDFYMIDCSNMIFIFSFGTQKFGTFLYILDEKLKKLYLKEKLNDYNLSSIMGTHLDKNRNNIIICESYIDMQCYNLKYEQKLIVGAKLIIFTEYILNKKYNEYSSLTLIEENKIVIAYFSGFEIYYSIVIFNGISLNFGNFRNIKLEYGYKTTLNLCNQIINYNRDNVDISLFFISENNYNNNGKIVNAFLNGVCSSFIINEVNLNEKYEIDFKNKISDGINGNIHKLYFSYIDKNMELYKNNKRILQTTEFNKNDSIYVKIQEGDKSLLRYIYENEECHIQFYTKKTYIYINQEPYKCKINPKIKKINNIIYNELADKTFKIDDKEFNFYIIFENKVEKNELIIFFLNEKINCKIDKEKNTKILCKGSLPKLKSNIFYKDYDIYSYLSCLNKIKIGTIKLRDKYLNQIYDINNLESLTNNVNQDYDPINKLKSFSVDMISYYYWFSGFSYCEDKSLKNNKCCQEELLNDWEILDHKEYKISFIERIINNFFAYKIGNIFDKIKAFLESFRPYIYNFIILKSKKYKKYIFGFPGTTGTKQLLFEFLGYSLQTFDSNEPNIKVESFFYETFKLIYKDLFSDKIINELNINSDYQIIFTGHSLGGAIATLSSYYYAKNKLSKNEPILITFGQPRVGNENFAKDYMKLIPLVFRVARKGDIVTIIPPAKQLKDLKFFGIFNIFKQFRENMAKDTNIFFEYFKKGNLGKKIGKFFEFIFNCFLNIIQFILSFLIGLIVKLPIFPYGYCHIGGLYILIDDKFYQCNDFYNQQTGHPICDNWEFETIYDLKNILDNHSYLRLGENLVGKCQKDKKFWIFL